MNSGFTNNGLSIKALRIFLSNEMSRFTEGEEILTIIAEKVISETDNYGFEEGITGFGWLIAYLHYCHYITINSDEILEDVDDQVYKYTIYTISNQKEDIHTLLGLVDYFTIRHLNKNPQEILYRKLIHYECINLIFDLFKVYLEKCLNKKKLTLQELTNCCRILLKFSFCLQHIKQHQWNNILIKYLVYLISFIKEKYNKKTIPYEELYILLLITKQGGYTLAENIIIEMILLNHPDNTNHFILNLIKNTYQKPENLSDNELLFTLTNYNFLQLTSSEQIPHV
ncbi:hypothetical protein KBP46_13705 [Chryseobacterium sp. PCH239]|uniref:hypothetical protein n=1 Tax=Chryseobacterium sp. PCH239 TaxID=2825845 RepID=UPI001C1039B0|nr:hypothetical protein [Chryseobacterium sp. PCH239]QWT84561.1 hypothetical protein KBP46_13705 [Chryseobacterium sp. PCH239]